MSEILSKSMRIPGAGTSPLAVAKAETNGDELLFAALFGGATSDVSADDDTGEDALFAVQTIEQENPENPLQGSLSVMVSALQAAKDFDQKQAGKVNEAETENSEAAIAGENGNALADIISAVPLGAHIDLVNGDVAKGVNADISKNTNPVRANMAFKDDALSGQATTNLPKIGLGPMQGPRSQTKPSETFIGPMPPS